MAGSSAREQVAWVTHMQAIVAVALQTDLWYEYVLSACNWADAPSRAGDEAEEVRLGFERLSRWSSRRVEMVFPSQQEWENPLYLFDRFG